MIKIGNKIKHEPGNEEAWICLCGSTSDFYPCDEDGNEKEQNRHWQTYSGSWNCGRIFENDTLLIVGVNPEPKRLEN